MASKDYSFVEWKEDRFQEGEVLFDSLLVLGFENYIAELKIKPQATIDKNSFKVPNPNAFLVVSHFLFQRLDRLRCEEEFKFCWPVVTKKDAQEFKHVCSKWLKELIKDEYGFLPKIPLPSILSAPGGPKFCHLYLALSRYIMKKVIGQLSSDASESLINFPKTDSSYVDAAIDILQSHIILRAQEIRDLESQLEEHSDTASRSTQRIVEIYYKQKENLEGCPKRISEIEEQMKFTEDDYKALLSEGRNMWQEVEQVYENVEHSKIMLQSVLSDSGDLSLINGLNYHIKPSKVFLNKHRRDMEKENVTELYSNKMLNVENFIKLAKITVNSYYQQLELLLPKIVSLKTQEIADSHRKKREELVKLNMSIQNELVPELEHSIRNLETKLIGLDEEAIGGHPFIQTTPRWSPVASEEPIEISLWTNDIQNSPIVGINPKRLSDLLNSPRFTGFKGASSSSEDDCLFKKSSTGISPLTGNISQRLETSDDTLLSSPEIDSQNMNTLMMSTSKISSNGNEENPNHDREDESVFYDVDRTHSQSLDRLMQEELNSDVEIITDVSRVEGISQLPSSEHFTGDIEKDIWDESMPSFMESSSCTNDSSRLRLSTASDCSPGIENTWSNYANLEPVIEKNLE